GVHAGRESQRGDLENLEGRSIASPLARDEGRFEQSDRWVLPNGAEAYRQFSGTIRLLLARWQNTSVTSTFVVAQIQILVCRTYSFNSKAQIYAAHGWAVLMVNYRGSTGYGQKFADAIFRDQNGGEAKDVLYGVEAALRRNPWIDRERLGVEGGSYGGQLTNWLITQTNRFRAAIPIAGISNLITQNYLSYYHDYLAVEFGAFPHQEGLMALLWQRSPIRHMPNVKQQVMLVRAENAKDRPIAEDERF